MGYYLILERNGHITMKKLLLTVIIIVSLALVLAPAVLAAAGDSNAADDAGSLGVKLAVIILVPLIVALLVCSIWKSKMKTARLARTADNFIPQGGFRLTGQEDRFLYRTTVRRKIERQK
jgi:cytochrome bd-type quinol oxidase subunit 2